jgi:three-Cys-motif partner protein
MASDFFGKRQGAAVLKHGILEQYLPVFVAKTGSYAPGRQVAYLDGYAGPGAYDDGAPGSPQLAIDCAQTLAEIRDVRCLFVEKHPATYEALCQHLARLGRLDPPPWHGPLEEHIDEVLARAAGLPLFAFLDPFGRGLPFTTLTDKILGRANAGWSRVKTEVLFNFSTVGIRREIGLLGSVPGDDRQTRRRATTMVGLDATLGGDWWREIVRRGAAAPEEQILRGYVARLAATGAGWSSWIVPVADRWEGTPDYHLVFLTQHPDGVWAFGEALSLASERFYDWCHDDQLELYPKEHRDAQMVQRLTANLKRLLADGRRFTVIDRYDEVFAGVLGRARGTHLRAALQQLHEAGRTSSDAKLLKKDGLKNKVVIPS